jgi:hypothetical protein
LRVDQRMLWPAATAGLTVGTQSRFDRDEWPVESLSVVGPHHRVGILTAQLGQHRRNRVP